MAYCLLPRLADEFKKRLKDGRINPAKLNKMTSKERHEFFKEFLGEENAKNVNALFESKLLLKNQQQGMINWAKTVTGIKPQARRDIIAKIEKLGKVLTPDEQKAFLEDLVEKRLGIEITPEEAKEISAAVKNLSDLKAKIDPTSPIGSKERMEYGVAKVLFDEQYAKMKLSTDKMTFTDYLKSPGKALYELAGTAKSVLSTLDNSFFGRQGVKVLYTHPTIWARNFIKSWGDIGKEFLGRDAMLPIKADVYSRPNALNGKYKALGIDINLSGEEAFPSSLPARIPILGRVFKGAESAFNGAALRFRADLADLEIRLAEKAGLDMLDPFQAEGIGKMVNSMTGRGSIGRLGVIGKEINAVAFSIKFLKSNFDTLTAHVFDKKASAYAKKRAATNLLKIIGGIAALNVLAEALWPGSTEKDPRSSNFGKIKINNTTFDISGGMSSLVVLAARVTPTQHEGEWGFWTKSSTTGEVTRLNAKDKKGKPKYGTLTSLDVIDNFWQGKLSPMAGVFRDIWRGQDFSGKAPTPTSLTKNAVTPLPVQKWIELMQDPDSANDLMSAILDGLGFGANTIKPKEKPKN